MQNFFKKITLLSFILSLALISVPTMAQVQSEDSVFSRFSLGFWGGGNNTFNTYSNGIGPQGGLRLKFNISPFFSLGVLGMVYRTGQSEKDYGAGVGQLDAVGSSNIAVSLFSRVQFAPTFVVNPYFLLGGVIHFPNAINQPTNIAIKGVSLTGSAREMYFDSTPIFGIHTGIGAEIFLSKKVALDLGISYQHLLGNRLAQIGYSQILNNGTPLEFDNRQTGFLTYNLGFSFHLGTSGKEKLTQSQPIAIQLPPPSVNFQVSPTLAESGSEVTLNWLCLNADSVVLNGVNVSVEGQRIEVLNQSKVYELVAFGKGGRVSKKAGVTISEVPAPAIAFIVKPDTIFPGEPVSLSWNTNDADEIFLNDSRVKKSGTQTDYPFHTQYYTLSASGKGGTVKKSQPVFVLTLKELSPANKVSFRVAFQNGESMLDSTEFRKFKDFSEQLKADSTLIIEIAVQTDPVPNRKAAEKLSLERAKAIEDFFIHQGVGQSQLKSKIPVDRENSNPQEPPNEKIITRKVEIKVIKE